MSVYCMYHECLHNEHHGETDAKKRKPGVCRWLEMGNNILIVPRWVSLNVVELHKYLELFPTCATVDLQNSKEKPT